MSESNETNELLREIRNILADRDRKYDEYLERLQKAYAEQVKTATETNKKPMRVLLVWITVLVSMVALYVKFGIQ